VVVDPVTEPDAYRRFLLAALGDRDPAEALAEGPATMRRLVAEAGDDLRVRPEPAEWSVLELLAHLADAELIIAARLRWIAAEDEPEIAPYDQDLWVSRLREIDEDPEVLLGAYEANRRWNLAFWRRLPVADRARVGHHRERGPESVELTFRLAAGHDAVHLGQARRTRDAVRGVASR
jgi:hypothetical protein